MKWPTRLPKTIAVLLFALALGALAAFVTSRYISGRLAEIEARSRGNTIAVIVAKQDLAMGTRLNSGSLAVREIPKDYAPSSAILPDEFSSIEGQELGAAMKAGETLTWSLLQQQKTPTFSARVASGRRAITVAVDEINAISGLLEPGDRIDLLLTLQRDGQKITAPLLQAVEVLATGQRMVGDADDGQARMYSTVTLDTDWQEAQNVVMAREAGRLTALLRNPEDTATLPGSITDLAALLAPQKPVPPPQEHQPRQVPVLYGGRSLPPQGLNLAPNASAAARATDDATNLADLVDQMEDMLSRLGGQRPANATPPHEENAHAPRSQP